MRYLFVGLIMEYFPPISLLALCWCILFCLIHFFRLVKLGKVKELSEKSGDVTASIVYSNTSAMLPNQKESAYKHLPTFTAGVIFHLGTFLSLLFFVSFVFKAFTIHLLMIYWWQVSTFLTCFLFVSLLCGFSLFLKRIFSKKLKPFSNLDDYFSIGIVILFQLFCFSVFAINTTIAIFGSGEWAKAFYNLMDEIGVTNGNRIEFYRHLFWNIIDITYLGIYVTGIILFLYLPFGKLKHVVYYFAARYHLGFFYGWRNTWPPRKKEKQ